ncbi:MAG: hypothetical protein ORN52_02075 [Beijerinckiaceae bacterium]|jgi:hypothetical protein|nr:hypothetical protein [Beijerinckiaceae bacterium]
MNESLSQFNSKSSSRDLRHLGVALTYLAAVAWIGVAHAAEDPCVGLGKNLTDRGQLIQHVQSFQSKKPTAEDACDTFTKLSKINATTVSALDRDGAWCRAPDTLAPNLKGQQAQIDAAKANACKVAEQQKKAQAAGGAQAHQPMGGADEIVGGAMKLPQGAL